MSSIFISHNHRDKTFVRRLAQDLRSQQIFVWVDEAEIKIGDSLIEKIREGIDEMAFVGVVLSSNSIDSSWVKKEVDIAMNQEIDGNRVKVLPLLIEDVDLPGFLKGKLYADFRQPDSYENELDKLTRRLKEYSVKRFPDFYQLIHKLESNSKENNETFVSCDYIELDKPLGEFIDKISKDVISIQIFQEYVYRIYLEKIDMQADEDIIWILHEVTGELSKVLTAENYV